MRIIVCVRTRNEERNIANFCRGYSFADLILVADGGSEDRTVEIARQFPNVRVEHYPVKLFRGDVWINPEVEHYHFLFNWVAEFEPDWIITDDCDCRPNKLLRENARSLLEATDYSLAFAVRLYIWEADNLRDGCWGAKHFPKLAKPGKHRQWEPSLWAFRAGTPIGVNDGDPWEHFRGFSIPEIPRLNLMPPYCLLHFPWPDEKAVKHKQEFGRLTGWTPDMAHPLDFGGPLVDCEEWMIE